MTRIVDHRNIFTWDSHKRAGLLGGDDFAVPAGDAVYAPVAGVARGSGSTVTILEASGRRAQVLHVSRIPSDILRGVHVTTDTVIGYASDALSPHLHDLTPDGVRVRSRLLTPAATPAASAATPIIDRQDYEMFLIQNRTTKKVALVTATTFDILSVDQYENLYKRVLPPVVACSAEEFEQARLDVDGRTQAPSK